MTKKQHAQKMLDIALAKLPDTKANTKIIERIESIKYEYEQGKDISYDDLLFLQSQHDFIKSVFCDDIVLWQIAGIR